MGKEFRYC